MSSKKKNEDQALFREAMSGVQRLPDNDRLPPEPRRTPPVARQRRLDEQAVVDELLDLDPLRPTLETGEELLFRRPDVHKRTFTRLRRGHYSVADTIDLHHMTEDTARQVLIDFIQHALEQGFSCVRVIHGKGLRSRDLPRLKIMTGQVLRKHPAVLAYASCRPVDGGTGATDVLLSARRFRP